MSQNTARRDSPARTEEEDIDRLQARPQARPAERSQRVRPRQPLGQPADGIGPDDPDESEFELIGDDDLSPADLGPANPNHTDPDADSGRIRKIS